MALQMCNIKDATREIEMAGYMIEMTDENLGGTFYLQDRSHGFTVFGSDDGAKEFATRGGARNRIHQLKADDRHYPKRRQSYRIIKSDG